MVEPFAAKYVHGATASAPMLFWEPVSPASVSVLLFLEATELPYVSYRAEADSVAHTSDPRFIQLNPDRTLPCLKHGALVLCTPNAIIRYLCQEMAVDDAFFPRAPRLRATLSSALDWSVFSLRRAVNDLANSLSLERTQLVDEYWGTNTGSGGAHTNKPNGLVSAIARLESIWVPRGSYVLSKTSHPSIADIVLFCDFTAALHACNMEEIITPALYPKLFTWKDVVSKFLASDLLDEFVAHQQRLGATRPRPPPRPDGLSLPWIDYRIPTTS